MNQQNKFLLPDKSFWMALDREQRKVLSSKYTILCPPILFTEIARHGLTPHNPWLNLENIIVVPHWSEYVKTDLLIEESSKPMPFGRATAMKSILESSEQELLEFKEASGENIEMLKEIEAYFKSLGSITIPLKEEMLSLVKNEDNLPEEEWVNKLREGIRANQTYRPEIERTLNKIEAEGLQSEGKEILQTFIERYYDTHTVDSLENANLYATRLLNHDPFNRNAAHETLQGLCTVYGPLITQEERTQIFNRFHKESMPPISRFAPYALGTAIWTFTINLYLRENTENAAPKNVLRDAEYLLYTFFKVVTFVSADKWHRKFVNEVPLFEGVREQFIFVDNRTKATIQEGFSKLL